MTGSGKFLITDAHEMLMRININRQQGNWSFSREGVKQEPTQILWLML
jgi:hypothetical protein